MGKNLVETIDTTTGEIKTQILKANQVWDLPQNLKVKLEISEDNTVVGTNESLLVTRFLGKVARRKDYCPIDVEEWSQMPRSIKDKFWALIKEKFSFDYDAGEYWALKILGKSWKRWKYELRKTYRVSEKPKEELLENTPSDVDKVQWSKFIDYYQSVRMKEISEKNTVKRKKLQINHTGGTKSNQRRAHEMEKELGRPVCRAEVILKTWQRKDGSYSTKYAENMAAIVLKNLPEDQKSAAESGVFSTIYANPYDAIGKALGPECSGRVRGLGIGISPSRKFGPDVCLKLEKKLLILDINGVLADILYDTEDEDPLSLVPDTTIGNHQVYMRKHCREFLEFCFEKFVVAIWSSKQRNNVKEFVEFLFGDMRDKLLFTWDHSECTTSKLHVPCRSDKLIVFKDLKKVWDRFKSFNAKNTLLVDDSPYKALLNPPHTSVFPHTYQWWQEDDNSLGEDGQLKMFLHGLANVMDVQEYVRTNPFGQPNINEGSDFWPYYKEAVDGAICQVSKV